MLDRIEIDRFIWQKGNPPRQQCRVFSGDSRGTWKTWIELWENGEKRRDIAGFRLDEATRLVQAVQRAIEPRQ